jgi:hypothetical protein
MPFTIDAVTQWIVQRYRDQIGQRGLSAAVGTTFFSLLQSLLYEYQAEWLRHRGADVSQDGGYDGAAMMLSGVTLRRTGAPAHRRDGISIGCNC